MENVFEQTAKKPIIRSWSPLTIWIPLWPHTYALGILSNRFRVNKRRGFFMQEARTWKGYFLSSPWFTLAINITKYADR